MASFMLHVNLSQPIIDKVSSCKKIRLTVSRGPRLQEFLAVSKVPCDFDLARFNSLQGPTGYQKTSKIKELETKKDLVNVGHPGLSLALVVTSIGIHQYIHMLYISFTSCYTLRSLVIRCSTLDPGLVCGDRCLSLWELQQATTAECQGGGATGRRKRHGVADQLALISPGKQDETAKLTSY